MSLVNNNFQNLISSKFTNEVFLSMLKKQTGLNDINVENIKFGEESKKGDSYLSTICRFVVEGTGKGSNGQEEKISAPIIVKYLPKNLARRKTYRSTDFFENEIIFYEKVWPAFDAFQNSKNVKEKFNKLPKLLSACMDGKNDYIAMEDLSYEGFGSAIRGNDLNYEQTVDILRLFAKFHSLALAFKDQQKQIFEEVVKNLKETYFAEEIRAWYKNFQQIVFDIVRDALAKELPPIYLEKFNKLISGDFFGKLCELCKYHGPLSVVTHGDAWIPNFLFKYASDNKTILDIVMIDFQLTRYTTLSNDITFFLYSCANSTLLPKHWDDFILEYHTTLSNTIGALGSNRDLVTLEALKADIKNSIPFAIGMSMEAVTMSLLDESDVSDLDAIKGEDAVPLESVWIVHPFKEQEKRKRLVSFIKHAVDNNFM